MREARILQRRRLGRDFAKPGERPLLFVIHPAPPVAPVTSIYRTFPQGSSASIFPLVCAKISQHVAAR